MRLRIVVEKFFPNAAQRRMLPSPLSCNWASAVRPIAAIWVFSMSQPSAYERSLLKSPIDRLLANVVKVPMNYLVPSVLALSLFGAFGLTGNTSGPITVMVFSLLGWVFKRFDYSVPAAVVGILLGGMAEDSFIYTYQISGGLWTYLFERPTTIAILILLVLSLFGNHLLRAVTRLANR